MNNKKEISVRQLDLTDCGAACLASVSAYYGHFRSLSQIRSEAGTNKNGTSLLGMVKASEKIGFDTSAVRIPDKKITNRELPAIAHLKIKNVWYHFVVIYSIEKEYFLIMDPAKGKLERVKTEKFKKDWTNILLLLKPGKNFKKESKYVSPESRFLAIIKPHKKALLKVTAGAIIYSILGITTAIYIKNLTDRIIPGNNINHLHIASLILSLFIILRVISGLLKNFLLLNTTRSIDSQLIGNYNRHILNLPSLFFHSMKTGEILSRISDAIKIRNFINMIVQELIVNILIVIITMIMMFIYSPLLSMIVLLSVPFYFLLYRYLNRSNKKYLRKTMELGAEMESKLVETIKGIKTIKAYNTEKSISNQLSKICKNLLGSIYKASRAYTITSSSGEFISSIVLVGILWIGAQQVIYNKMSYGELFSFYSLYAYLSSPLISLILSNRGIQDAKIAADRLFQVMELNAEGNNLSNEKTLAINKVKLSVENLAYGYPGHQLLFKDLSFKCEAGTINALVGESGSGKSTLISILLKFYQPDKGNIFFNQLDYDSISNNKIRSFSSYVPQEVKLFTGSLGENIALSENDWDKDKMENCLYRAGLNELIERQQHGLNTYISEDGTNFSGGEKQKIAIARALYKDSPLFLLDEPSSSMDLYSEKYILELLEQLKKEGKTILIAAHKLSMIRSADQILVLNKGKLTESGSHDELIYLKGNYHKLWKYQNQDIMRV